MSNHLNKFYAAVSALAGHGDIKQRLIHSFEEHLAHIEDDGIPAVVKHSFGHLRNLMSGVDPLNGEGRIRATVRKMSITEAEECAQIMIDVYTDLVRFEDQAQESLPLGMSDQASVPPFLVKSG